MIGELLAEMAGWILLRRYELVFVVWLVLLSLSVAGKRAMPRHTQFLCPGVIALGVTPAIVTVLLWPGAQWPQYRDAFFERAYHLPLPGLEAGFSSLIYHPGYIAASFVGIYALVNAISAGALPFSRGWAYASLAAFYMAEELVFFRITVVE